MQLAKILKDDIARGAWRPDDVLPSIKALAERYHTSEKVPRKALEILAEEGWTVPRRSVGSILVDRGIDKMLRGRVLVYSRGTGYSYYCAAFMSIFDARLLASGYKTFIVNSDSRGERNACSVFKALLKEKWDLVVLRARSARALKLVEESFRPFVLLGNGAPLPRTSAPSCIARVATNGGKALPDFLRECVRRGIKRVVQFKYAEGTFDVTERLTHAGIKVETVGVGRKSSPEEVSVAALSRMRRMIAKRPLPDVFVFTDDYLAQGALVALSDADIRIPEDVAVVTLSNKGHGPIWGRPLSRLEMDASVHAGMFSDAVVAYFRTGRFPADLELGSVWKRGETF
jgi:DNA-binding LacI/PurR family transcriptional regulator